MSILQPTYYTRHPDETYSVADPQPNIQPVKQEPVAYTNKEQVNELIKESARLIGSIKDEGDQYLTAIDALRNAYRIGLKDSPVSAEAIRAEALEEAAKVCEKRIGGAVQNNEWWSGFKAAMKQCAAAIRARGEK